MGVRGIRKIGQVSITVEDTAKAVSFYRDALGLSYIWETNGMAFFPRFGRELDGDSIGDTCKLSNSERRLELVDLETASDHRRWMRRDVQHLV
ncbi:VOC family protein [Alicyclobacillus acidiphilus]|uniref:VOC family protein n=1 Tax=Alicyclobacillus acidiphilus TaxID=182455 RepID=UPI000833BFA3